MFPALFAVLALLVTLLLSHRHRLVQKSYDLSSENEAAYYFDLDHDGKSEWVRLLFHLTGDETSGIIGYSSDGKIIDQWNFKGIGKRSEGFPLVGDIDGDGRDEVVVFSWLRDTLYMSCVDILGNRILFRDRPVEKIRKQGKTYDVTVYPGVFYDVDGDGYKEIFFSLMSGFAKHPRGVYRYNMVRDEVIRSPEGCATTFALRTMIPAGDTIPVIYTRRVLSPANCDSLRPFSDHYCWLMAYRPDLSFYFPPIRFPKGANALYIAPAASWPSSAFLILFHHRSFQDGSSFLALIDGQGKIRKKKNISTVTNDNAYCFFPADNKNGEKFLFNGEGELFRIDSLLHVKKIKKLSPVFNVVHSQCLDLDYDGHPEIVMMGKVRNEIQVLSGDLREAVKYSFPYPLRKPVFTINKRGALAPPELFVSDLTYDYRMVYSSTLVYSHWYVFFLLYFLLACFLMFILRKIREYRRLKVSDAQRKIYELQLRSFQNQLDPHFTFNAITSLGTLIYTEEKETAYDYLVKFSALIRKILESSDKISRTLQEELDFVRNYLELQKYRFREKFTYEEDIGPGVNLSTRVPRMIIETHVENALKHGLLHSSKKGVLRIVIRQEQGGLRIEVIDNGIGREKARQISRNSTHLGMRVTEQFYTLINKYNRYKIMRTVEDLFDEKGEPAGTRVVIRIPKGIRYEI